MVRFMAGTSALERERPGDFDTPAFDFFTRSGWRDCSGTSALSSGHHSGFS